MQAPFERRQPEGRLRLLCLLRACMIRASKAELLHLGIPALRYRVGGFGSADMLRCGSVEGAEEAPQRVRGRGHRRLHRPPACPAHAATPPRPAPTHTVRPRQATFLDFAPAHAASYNAIVDMVRFNLMTSDW